MVVSLQGPQTVSALAERLDVHASTMTRMCNRLVARGLVVRKPSAIDRREVVIELTAPGQGLVDEVMDKRRREIDCGRSSHVGRGPRARRVAHWSSSRIAADGPAAAADDPRAARTDEPAADPAALIS